MEERWLVEWYPDRSNSGCKDWRASTADEARSRGDDTGKWLGSPSNAVVVTCVGGEQRQQVYTTEKTCPKIQWRMASSRMEVTVKVYSVHGRYAEAKTDLEINSTTTDHISLDVVTMAESSSLAD